MSEAARSGTAGREAGDDGKVTIFDFASLLRTLRRRLAWIAVPTILFPIVVAGISLTIPNHFWATAQVLVDPDGMQVLEGELATSGRSEQTALIYAQNQAYIMGSNSVLMEVVERENLADDIEFGAAPPGLMSRLRPSSGPPAPRDRLALRALQQNFSVTLNDASFVVNASVRSRDPQKAARIANAIAQTYIAQRADTRAAAVGRAADGLSAQLDHLRGRVEDGERAVQAYRVANGIVDADGRRIGEQRLADITTEITRVGARIAEDEALAAEVARLRADSGSVISVAETNLTPAIVSLRARQAQALEEEEALASSLGSRHPSYQLARTRSESVSRLLDAELQRFGASVDQRLARSRGNLAALEAQLGAASEAVTADNQSSVELRELERRAASDRLVYEAFLLRTRQLSEQEQAVNPENPQIIAAALAPLDKAGPPRTMMTGGALVFGFLFGVGLAMLREQFDQPSGARAEATPQPPVPLFKLPARRRAIEGEGLLASREEAPTFFALADQIARTRAGRPVACIAIAGRDAGERAFVALNTAIAAAKAGHGVLLVDAADGFLSNAFGHEDARGLGDLSDGFDRQLAIDVEHAGFTFLPRGQAVGNPARTVDIGDLLARNGSEFDLVVVDMAAGAPVRHDAAVEVGAGSGIVPRGVVARVVRG